MWNFERVEQLFCFLLDGHADLKSKDLPPTPIPESEDDCETSRGLIASPIPETEDEGM